MAMAGLLLAAGMASAASLTGYISDSFCGAGNGTGAAESRKCTKDCLSNGATAVFVTEKDKKVYKLAGKDVKPMVDHKVTITGDLKGDTFTVTDVKKAD
jgi:hypothetical protein